LCSVTQSITACHFVGIRTASGWAEILLSPLMDASFSLPPRESDLPEKGQVDAWLQQARDGSNSALGRAFEAGRAYLQLIASRTLDDKLKSKLGASDLVQDTYVDAQRDFAQFRGQSRDEFYAWLTGILAHRLANTVRRYRLTSARDVDREIQADAVEALFERLRDDSATPGAAASALEEQHRVQTALERMREPMRSILVERTWQGVSFVEIGARHDLSADAARKTWTRAVREMQRLLLESK
jgi:RNA polymerase sigma-70 factor, ECF subfamily